MQLSRPSQEANVYAALTNVLFVTLYSHLLMILMLFYFGANMELCELLLSGDKVKALANALLMQEGVPWRQFCILQLLSVCFFIMLLNWAD